MKRIENRKISNAASLLSALKQMDKQHVKMLLVFEGERFVSILTIGDVQRAIIQNVKLTAPIAEIVSTDKKFAHVGEPMEEIKQKMLSLRAECMPVLDENGNLVEVLFWNDLFKKAEEPGRDKINLPVVIMAGGKGTRLKPITNVIPKPLVPIGDKTILEEIMDQFEAIGCCRFYMSVNYKSDIF